MKIFIENNKSGIEHMLIIRAIIKLFQNIDESNSKIFCSKSLFNQQQLSDFFRLEDFTPISVFSSGRRFTKLFSEIYFFLRLLTVWRSLFMKKNNHVIFTSLYPTSHLFLRLISPLIKCTVTVVLHSEVAFLHEKENGGIFSANFWMKMAFRYPSSLINYIVLGDHITVEPFVSRERILHINHPIEDGFYNIKEKSVVDKDIICVGHIGLVSKLKRSQLFFELSTRYSGDSRIRFVCAGSVSNELRNTKNINVEADFSGNYLTNDVMDIKLRQMSFAVFTYGDLYAHVASGAILEAIRYGIPILCLRNSYFSFLQSNEIIFFEIFDDIESMSRRIDYILDFGVCMKTLHAAGLEKARKYFSFDASLIRIKKFYG